jgi:hypothetical protein
MYVRREEAKKKGARWIIKANKKSGKNTKEK